MAVTFAAVLTAGLTVAAAPPAQAHTTGPQLVSHVEGIAPPAPGVDYSLLSTGSAPYVTVSLRGNHTFEIRGLRGEPFIRLTAAGVDVNRNSPSLYLTTDPSKKPTVPATVNPQVSWEHVADQPTEHYYETRAEWPHLGQPVEAQRLGRTATVYRFAIPALFDGQTAAIEGHVTWIPAPINLEVPLLFVPLVVVLLLWIEPKAKPYLAGIARAVAVAAVAAAAIEAVRAVLDLESGASGAAGLAPLAVVPGLALLVVVAVPRLLRADRRAYGWVLAFGAYLLVFGLLRRVAPTAPAPTLGAWLRRSEIVAGFLVAAGAGLLLFLSSPVRKVTHTYGPKGRRPVPN